VFLGLLAALVRGTEAHIGSAELRWGDCAVSAEDGTGPADRPSSVCGSVHRNRGRAALNGCVAGEGIHSIGDMILGSFHRIGDVAT